MQAGVVVVDALLVVVVPVPDVVVSELEQEEEHTFEQHSSPELQGPAAIKHLVKPKNGVMQVKFLVFVCSHNSVHWSSGDCRGSTRHRSHSRSLHWAARGRTGCQRHSPRTPRHWRWTSTPGQHWPGLHFEFVRPNNNKKLRFNTCRRPDQESQDYAERKHSPKNTKYITSRSIYIRNIFYKCSIVKYFNL